MKKLYILAVALSVLSMLISTGALADTFIGLNNPDMVSRWTCAGEAFSTDGSTVTGLCEKKVPSTAKYAQPARYQYAAAWDLTGAVTLGALTCYSPQHFGVDHSGCPTMVSLLDTNEVVVLDGTPFWYVTSNALGDELLHIQTGSLVYLP